MFRPVGVLLLAAFAAAAFGDPGSSDEVAHYTLVVTTCHLQVGSLSTWTRCYNGTVPGPTLRVKPGQLLHISLVNGLAAHGTENQILNVTGYGDPLTLSNLSDWYNASSFEEAEGTGTLFGYPNTTNLHLHGLVVPAAMHADNVLMAVKPGEVFEYHEQVPPNHMGGTLWYHPHHHHSTAGQAHGGMFGALIVEDPPASLPPAVAEAEERLLLVDTLDVGLQRAVARMSMDDLWQTESNASVTLVNGALDHSEGLQSGKWYRLRFVYASMFSSIRLALNSDTASCQMQLLAKDGIYLNEAPRRVSRIWLASGNRADVLVSCSCKGSTSCRASFRSEWGPRDAAEFSDADGHWNGLAVTRTWVGDVFHLDVTGESIAAPLPSFKPKKPCYLADLTSLSSPELRASNQVNISMWWEQEESNDLRGERSEELADRYASLIRGKFGMVFNNTRNRMLRDGQHAVGTLPFDEVQEWSVTGTSYHPFHLHGQPFQIAALASKEELVETLITHNAEEDKPLGAYLNDTIWSLIDDDDGWFKVGDWADTFHDLGNQVLVRMAPRVPHMTTMIFHCHYLNHEDQGMMTFVDVVGESGPCTKGAQCAKALDPQCYTEASEAGYTLTAGPSRLLRR